MVGFTVGWLLWVSRLGTCGAVSNLLVDYGATLWPPLVHPLARAGTISALAFVYTLINVRGIRQTAAVSTVFTMSKLIPLTIFVAVGLFFVEPHALTLGSVPRVTDVSTAILLATFAFFGFDATTVIAGEVRNAPRSVPFAILLSVGSLVILYALIQIVCVGTLPKLAVSQRPLADAATMFFGSWGSSAIAAAAVIACAGVFGASMTAGTRLLFAMSDHRQLPIALARVHPGFHTPVVAIVVTAGATWLLALSGSFIYLVKLTLIARVTVYAITCGILVVFRQSNSAPEASFKAPGGEVVASAGGLLCVLFLASSSMRELLDVAVALVIGLTIFGITQFASGAAVTRST